MIKLSKRLQVIADRVTQGARVADIGSDHALLPVYLIQSGKCPTAIAGELNTGPFQAARRQTAEAGLKAVVQVRQGDGLSVLEPGEADTVTIAGMGGSLMADILEAGWRAGKLTGVTELVLQPNVGEDFVRRWLTGHAYVLRSERLIEEDGHLYEILHAHASADERSEQENGRVYDTSVISADLTEEVKLEWLYRMGPFLLREPSELLRKKWKFEIDKLARICKQLSLSDLDESRAKLTAYREEIRQLEEVLACL
ncbi:tRNA (adenine(22)-N(1))-methyltransferase [Paenibacillus solisilvae]|uniref:tRNA (Adenine(22)-N(1))-methyltransferase n=1 Tax=Paenibacillus solisilvae TaxID=2486751 RepID=A0ABW0W1H2_9BACL